MITLLGKYNNVTQRLTTGIAGSALTIFCTVLIGFYFIGPLIGFFIAMPFMEGSLVDFGSKITQRLLYPEVKLPLYIIQGSATLFGLVLGPLLYWIYSKKQKLADFTIARTISPLTITLTAMVVISSMAANSLLIDWNTNVVFPDTLKGFEEWARGREMYATELTQFMTTFGSTGEFLIAFFVVAVLPGIGEELVFRGMLQPELHRSTKNVHAAIWISAFLFSSLHMQFFGFLPRLFLGALFGYLYLWSGNLIVPIVAHFVNNAFLITMMYLHQLGKIDIDVESTKAVPWPAVISGTILTFALLVYLKILFERNRPAA